MKSKIKDLESFIEYVDKREKDIYKKIFQTYGFPKSKIKNLPSAERELIKISTGIDMRIEEVLSELVSEYDDDELRIFNLVRDNFEFTSKAGFFEVLSKKSGENVHVVDLKSSVFETLSITGDYNLKKGDLFYGFTFYDSHFGEDVLYPNYIILTEEERFAITEIYGEYYVDNDLDLFFDNVVIPRLMKTQLNQIDDIITRHSLATIDNFDQLALFSFFKHFSDTVKYTLFSSEEIDIYNLDYFDFLMKETSNGNFVIEGDLEVFIEVLEFIMIEEVRQNPSREAVLESIELCRDNIFILKHNLSKKYPPTPIDLLDLISDNMLIDNPAASGILAIGYYMDAIANCENGKVTKKTKRLTTKTVNEIITDNPILSLETGKDAIENAKTMIQLALAIMLSNGLAHVKDDDELYITNRFGFFVMTHPDEIVANITTALFKEGTIEQYIGLKNEDYSRILREMMDFMINLDPTNLNKSKGGKKILYLFEILKYVEKIIFDGIEIYKHLPVGEIYSEYLKSQPKNGKILQLNQYK